MAPVIITLTVELAGALRATIRTRLEDVQRSLRVYPVSTSTDDDLRLDYEQQLTEIASAIEAGIAASFAPHPQP